MTKQQLQKELQEKVKPGTKPSDLKKLKRSKSDSDITPPFPPNQLLQDQLKEKQKEVESLRQQLEAKNTELNQVKSELDNSFQARLESLKDFGAEHDKRVKVEKELDETVAEASQELISQDQNLVDLRNQVRKLQLTNQSLQRDLNQRRIGTKDNPAHFNSKPNWEKDLDLLRYLFYGGTAVILALFLLGDWSYKKYRDWKE